MNRWKTTIVCVLLIGTVESPSSWAVVRHSSLPTRAATSSHASTQQVWIQWKPTASGMTRTLHAAGVARMVKNNSSHFSQVIEVAPGGDPKTVAQQIMAAYPGQIEFAVENFRVYPQFTPDDPNYSLQYHLPLSQFPTAWDTGKGSGIKIAIADTGIDTHVDLSAHVLSGKNTFLENTNTTDVCGHGTAVAGTAAAIGNNSIGVVGGAYEASILPIKIVDDVDCSASIQDIDEAIRYAADQGARVINISFGSDSFCDTAYLVSAAQYMRARGGSVVKSAGNTPTNKGCSDTAEIVEVAATTSTDAIASFSNFGNEVDIAAPGVDIETTFCNTCIDIGGSDYGSVDGTSFSAPLAASVLALIYQVYPSFTPAQAEQVLFDSADDLGAAGRDIRFGYGRINAARAVANAGQRALALQRETLSNVYAYPNPWDARQGYAQAVTIANLPDTATVKLFTVSGMWIRTLQASNGRAVWDLQNNSGQPVASGLYFYFVSAPGDNKVKGKIALIR